MGGAIAEYYNCTCPDCGGYKERVALSATENNRLLKAFNKIARWAYTEKKTVITADDLDNKHIQALTGEINSILQGAISEGIAYEIPAAMLQHLRQNVYVFSGCKTFAELREISDLLVDDKGEIKPFSRFFKDTRRVHNDYNGAYLESEYLFATQSAQMASKWADFEKDGDEYNLQYRTANDDRVRYSHQLLHNITLPPSNPFWSKFMPPNGWRCRCNVVQVRKERYPVSNSENSADLGNKATYTIGAGGKNTSEMFRFNPGKRKTIFPETHPYFKAASALVLKKIEQNEKRETPDKIVSKKYKSGGEIQQPEHLIQNSQEQEKNTTAYTYLAKNYGAKYRLLSVVNKHGLKNPDALNLVTNKFSDAKIPTSPSGKNAVQNAIKEASKQGVSEVYIYLENEYKMQEIWAGLKAALQKGRAKPIETVIIKMKSGEVKKYKVEKLRKVFKGSK
ncbi:hypothetical protein D0T49_00305 [Paludibacter sp. 221]|uniref:phage minor head protein n=1 Tax=Paludibacter sp. 221 TaxID=2302939 RepID=UPI0013D787D7|nr:phage minor head protein [Paludibacter sp. 221]NDV45494.1 hypothetical protein [Paludibacter sp. 221]